MKRYGMVVSKNQAKGWKRLNKLVSAYALNQFTPKSWADFDKERLQLAAKNKPEVFRLIQKYGVRKNTMADVELILSQFR